MLTVDFDKISTGNSQLSRVMEGKITVKTKAVKTQYKMDLM
jgi:hypothetical protein